MSQSVSLPALGESVTEGTVTRWLNQFINKPGRFWFHLDVDVLSSDANPAVSYPQPGGLAWDEVEEIARQAMTADHLIGIDIAGYNPDRDADGATARAIVKALAGVHRMALRSGSPRAALLGVWALALFPASFVFSMTYASSLFLAASVWAFVLVEEHHDIGAAVLAAGATVLRPNGVIVADSLAVAVRTTRRIAILVVPSVLALAAWCWYCYDRTGDAFVFLTTKERWQEIGATDLIVWDTYWADLVVPRAGF